MKSALRNAVKVDDKLDPLFDYSKMRPPVTILDDDDDDDDVQILDPSTLRNSKLPSTCKASEGNAFREPVHVGEAAKVVNDDWLEPAPSKPACHRVLLEDPTLLKLRQQKQELQKILQASEASAKNIEEAKKLDEARAAAAAILETARSQNIVSEQAPSKRQKILLKLQGQTGDPQNIRICVDDKLEKLFTHYANNFGKRPVADFVFSFDGRPLNANSSPKDLDLEDEDIVEVYVKGARR